MDTFTQTALARSRGTSLVESIAPVEAEKSPITIEERLKFAYPDGVPKVVAEMLINWTLPAARDFYHQRQAGKAIADQLEARADAAYKRAREIEEQLPELETRLTTLRMEYAGLRSQLERPPALHLDPRTIGMMAVDQAGYVKLIAALEVEIEKLRPEPARARRESEALRPLGKLAGMIAGYYSKGVVSPQDFGFDYEWQLCAPSVRKEREAAHREEMERKRVEALQREAQLQEHEMRNVELAEAERAKAAEEARIGSLSFEGVMGLLFFNGQELTLTEIKRQVAAWNHHNTLRAAIDMWPEKPHPDLWTNVRAELVEMTTGGSRLFQRAAERLAQLLHPGSYSPVALINQVAEAETRQPTLNEIDALDFDGLLNFIFAGKPKTLNDLPTFKTVIEALPKRSASNTLQAADKELFALGVTESALYNRALQRLSRFMCPEQGGE